MRRLVWHIRRGYAAARSRRWSACRGTNTSSIQGVGVEICGLAASTQRWSRERNSVESAARSSARTADDAPSSLGLCGRSPSEANPGSRDAHQRRQSGREPDSRFFDTRQLYRTIVLMCSERRDGHEWKALDPGLCASRAIAFSEPGPRTGSAGRAGALRRNGWTSTTPTSSDLTNPAAQLAVAAAVFVLTAGSPDRPGTKPSGWLSGRRHGSVHPQAEALLGSSRYG